MGARGRWVRDYADNRAVALGGRGRWLSVHARQRGGRVVGKGGVAVLIVFHANSLGEGGAGQRTARGSCR